MSASERTLTSSEVASIQKDSTDKTSTTNYKSTDQSDTSCSEGFRSVTVNKTDESFNKGSRIMEPKRTNSKEPDDYKDNTKESELTQNER